MPAARSTKPAPLAARRAAAERFRPDSVELLIVAEAPPCDTDRYFYFEHVDRHDWLFRYIWEGLAGKKPERLDKPRQLAALKRAGVFLIDLHEENSSNPTLGDLRRLVPDLVSRCESLKPARIVLVKSIVHDAAYEPLAAAGLPVADVRMPFPASGQQKKFLEFFREALSRTGFSTDGVGETY